MKPIAVVLSCEHAVNHVPEEYRPHFMAHEHLLNSHRGIDFGAEAIASYLRDALACELVSAKATRLLIDCNRSLHHRHCFSEITYPLPINEKELIRQRYYLPFRQDVEARIHSHLQAGKQVWHLSVHSFTPILNEITRNTEIGLLYDPKRLLERNLARHWQQQIKYLDKGLRVRLNYPYRGVSDGFAASLRKKYPASDYLGLEIESNQALVHENHAIAHLACVLSTSLRIMLDNWQSISHQTLPQTIQGD
ncbi:N-formylglutamate amidohydrolase [Legionella rubrilucens]|uniref:N-formylglutamate amidohydrolase n=1 Tax=Legionella rubrilucens TaxID=458 RepID=A0A0W0XLZ7_9GAMM|nr:N-formylglutamate amidohydrolase [Legionella rubrilucens]KTD45658.1 N-formylglutamate amidohydrolase [Legionella rubrilucens]